MTDFIASHLEIVAAHAHIWGFIFIFVFMAVESSFIPFPSEVVMIPAGFMAMRGELTTGIWWVDCILAIIIGTMGSMAGACINYWIAEKLGRSLMYKYGKYFFLKKDTLERAEEVFCEYGDIATFVCRLIPAIRQLISLPAGFAKMKYSRFLFFTALGAGIWVAILTFAGAWFGHLAGNMTYLELVRQGKKMIQDHYVWVFIGLAVIVVVYMFVHKTVMKRKNPAPASGVQSTDTDAHSAE